MKKLIASLFCVALVGCGGGYDDMDAARLGGGGIGSTPSSPSVPSTPSNPDGTSLWEYDQVGTSRFADINSINTVPTANKANNALMSVRIHNFVDSSGAAKDYLTITVLFADTKCASSCQLRYKRNGSTSGIYTVRTSVNGVFSDDSFANGDMEKLIKAIKLSGKASITVPLIGVPDAEFEFDFSGYDAKFMDANR
jgi:hypothetical protein